MTLAFSTSSSRPAGRGPRLRCLRVSGPGPVVYLAGRLHFIILGSSADSISQLCVKAGAAVSEVLEATGTDPQYGPGFSGASTIRAGRDRYLYRVVAQALVRDRLGASVASTMFHYGKL